MTRLPTMQREKRVLICDRIEASRLLLRCSTGQQIRHLISIGDPDEQPPAGFDRPPHRLRLSFFDATNLDSDVSRPQAADVSAIIEFARAAGCCDGDMLIHCTAGISRSTAAALCRKRLGPQGGMSALTHAL